MIEDLTPLWRLRRRCSSPLMRESRRLDEAIVIAGRTFTTTLWSHAPVAAAFLRMLRNASRTFRAGTGPSGPQSATCPSGPPNQAADGRRHFYWYLPDIAPFVFWRPRRMFSITSCLHGRHNHAVDVRVHPGHTMAQRCRLKLPYRMFQDASPYITSSQ